ncbi:kelch-like protein 41a [Sitodiplosis mosellana]|uniref:kelch-like protein 41a n=1 Tax=Sitodiplosis mosellana TaxID=263140 RepID=UPI002444A82B|nr:kelch-like protein 41a [Sitodiplosis mosellana]
MKTIIPVPLDATVTTSFSSNAAARATKKLFLDEDSANFHFVFDSDNDRPMKLPVHKIILAAASPVFHTMFYGSLEEKTEVEIVDVSFGAFKEFLQYFYLADVTLTMEHVPGVMYLGEKYEITECSDACSTFLMQNLTADTVCWAYEVAVLFKRKDLMEFCNTLAKSEISAVVQSRCFMECDQKVLRHILKLDPLSGPNTDVFQACIAWAKSACQQKGLDGDQPQNVRDQLGQAFYEMPFALISQANFFNFVPPNATLFANEDLVEIIQMVASSEFQPTKFVKWASAQGSNNQSIRLSRIVNDSFVIKNIETTTFSSNKSLMLKGISFANVYHFNKEKWTYFVVKFPISKITITTKGHDDQPQKKKSPKILFNGEITLVTHGTNQVDLPSPILIKPGIKYEICLQQEVPPSSYTFNTLKPLLRFGPDVEIRFHPDTKLGYENTATGLVTGLSVERLETVMNCDLV